MREIEDRISVGGRDRDEKVTSQELGVEEAEVLTPQEDRNGPVHRRNASGEIPRGDRDAREPLLALRHNPRRSDDEVHVPHRVIEGGDDVGFREHVGPVHRALERLVADRTRVDQDQLRDAEVLHRAGDRADVAFLLGGDEHDPRLEHGVTSEGEACI